WNHKEDLEVTLSVRPEEFILSLDRENEANGLKGTVRDSVYLGLNTHYFIELESGETVEVIQVSKIGNIISPSTEVVLTIDSEKINVFDAKTEQSLMRDVVQDLEGDSHEKE